MNTESNPKSVFILDELLLFKATAFFLKNLFIRDSALEKDILNGLEIGGFEPAMAKKEIKALKKSMMQAKMLYSWSEALRGYPISIEEKNRCLYLGAITRVYDDLMDDFGYSHEEVMDIATQNPHRGLRSDNPRERLCRKLLCIFAEKTIIAQRSRPYFEYCLQQMGQAQNDSLRQAGAARLSEAELLEITYRKGAYTILIHRALLDHPLLEAEIEASAKLGSFFQLSNDLFDLYKDRQEHIQTLPSTCTSLHPVKETLEQLLAEVIKCYGSLPYKATNKQMSLLQIMQVACTAKVCMAQFMKLQGEAPTFDPSLYSRKQLICDMEKPRNIFRNLINVRALVPTIKKACAAKISTIVA